MSGPKAPVNPLIEAIPVPRNTALVLARALKVLGNPVCNHNAVEHFTCGPAEGGPCLHQTCGCLHELASAVVSKMRFPQFIVRSSEPAAE